MKCSLCQREARRGSRLCRYHMEASKALRSSYSRWMEAYGPIEWNEYLKRVKERPETGRWVKDVIESGERFD